MSDLAGRDRLLRWVEIDGARPPRVLHLFFWGAIAAIAVMHLNGLVIRGQLVPPGWPLADGLYYANLSAVVVAACLWPALPWRPSPSAASRSQTVAFLAAALLLMVSGNIAALVMVSLAIGNVVAVFGISGGLGYSAVVSLFGFVLTAVNAEISAFGSVVNAVVLLFLCLAMVVLFSALLAAWNRGAETRRLLAELDAAHRDLRRNAARIRELTIAEERTRMAREMHDSIGHYLTVINLGLANAQRFRPARPEEAWGEVAEAQRLTQEALTDARRWVRALKPLHLEGRTGVDAMRELAESLSAPGLAIEFTAAGEWGTPENAVELVCYRAFQEGITNAVRHSGAGRVRATLQRSASGVELTVADDGTSPDGAVARGFGLAGLEERLAEVDGSLYTGRSAMGGFEMRVVVPLEESPEFSRGQGRVR